MEDFKTTFEVPIKAWTIVDDKGELCILNPSGTPGSMILIFSSDKLATEYINKSAETSGRDHRAFELISLDYISEAIKRAQSIGARHVGFDFQIRIGDFGSGKWWDCDSVLHKIASMLN